MTILALPTDGLPAGRTVEQALERAVARHRFLRDACTDEDQIIADLTDYCTRLMGGSALSGKLLASAALWEPLS